MTVRTLVLLRHGKSAYPGDVADHDRPLDERGEREVPVAGAMLGRSLRARREARDGTALVDLVLVSSALRAQQTWRSASAELGEARQVETRSGLYLAGAEELLATVQGLPDDASTVLVVGHNEGLEDLASALSGNDVRLKTSTFAQLCSGLPWSRWSAGSAELVEVVVAR